MKKYLIALIPIIVCTILAVIYGNVQPTDFPDQSYPYRTPEMLSYLSSRWFLIGLVLGALCFIIILVEDVFDFIEKKRIDHSINKCNRK
jgi:hypothetical protein